MKTKFFLFIFIGAFIASSIVGILMYHRYQNEKERYQNEKERSMRFIGRLLLDADREAFVFYKYEYNLERLKKCKSDTVEIDTKNMLYRHVIEDEENMGKQDVHIFFRLVFICTDILYYQQYNKDDIDAIESLVGKFFIKGEDIRGFYNHHPKYADLLEGHIDIIIAHNENRIAMIKQLKEKFELIESDLYSRK